MSSRYPLALIVAAATFLGADCALQASETDDRIEASAKTTYVYRTYLKNDDITVQAKDGNVTLTGTVAEESHRALAQDTVECLPGVKRVDNHLELKGEKAAEKSDAWIGAKVKASLWFHSSVARKTDVYVKDGVVTLNGTATSQAQKDLTTEYAQDVEGVRSVTNQMTLVEGTVENTRTIDEQIDDASITAQVKLALDSRRSTSTLRTKAVTQDGVVTLTGEAKNQAEKDLVGKLTGDIDGVRSVTNNMTIKV